MSDVANQSKPYAEIAGALQLYFDGLYHSDTQRLRKFFHPKAIYACGTEGNLLYLTMEEYFPIVDKRPSPAGRGEARNDRIVSIAFAGPMTASVRLNCSIGPKFFTDLLTLIRLDDRWQIISKVFHFDLTKT